MLSILIVNGDPGFHALLRYVLEPSGLGLDSVCAGKEAPDRIAKKDYAVVLIDALLPEMNGFALVKKIRGIKPYQPIAVLSGSAEPDLSLERQARSLGVFYCLSRRLEAEQILQIIYECFKAEGNPPPAPEPVRTTLALPLPALPAIRLKPAASF